MRKGRSNWITRRRIFSECFLRGVCRALFSRRGDKTMRSEQFEKFPQRARFLLAFLSNAAHSHTQIITLPSRATQQHFHARISIIFMAGSGWVSAWWKWAALLPAILHVWERTWHSAGQCGTHYQKNILLRTDQIEKNANKKRQITNILKTNYLMHLLHLLPMSWKFV